MRSAALCVCPIRAVKAAGQKTPPQSKTSVSRRGSPGLAEAKSRPELAWRQPSVIPEGSREMRLIGKAGSQGYAEN
jgi:hypothetical protein